MPKTPITVAHGDGIGPEIMRATLRILEAAGAQIEPEVIEVGEKLYLQGNTTGLGPEALGIYPSNKSFPQSTNHYTSRWRLQKSQCNH